MKISISVTVLKSTSNPCLYQSWVAISWMLSKIERYPTSAALHSRQSLIIMRDTSDSNECVISALAVGVAPVERKDSGRYRHSSRVESQTAEKKLLYRFKRFDGFDCESLSTNRCIIDDLAILAGRFFLKQYTITLFDRNFMGVFIKSFIDGKDKHIYLLCDREN